MELLDNQSPDYSQYNKATPGDRFVAVLIDYIIYAVLVAIFSRLHGLLGWLVGLSYLLLRDSLPFLDGQSIGKRLMKMRAINAETGESLSGDYEKSAIRSLSMIIPIFNIVDAIMVFNDDRLRFGDKWAKTTVIKEDNSGISSY